MRILLAEDECDLNQIIRQKLTSDGYVVDCCFDGEEAMDYMACADYDAIIPDIMMPQKDGLEVLRSLRQSGKGTPVLFLTARDAISDRVKGLGSGANDYLVKPFSFEELTARLRAMTRGRLGMVSNVITVPLAVLLPHWRSLERERPMELIRRRHLSPRRSLSVKTVSMCEYTIDAVSGTVLEYYVERDD